MNRTALRWWNRLLRRIGIPGVVGLIVLLVAVSSLFVRAALDRESDRLRTALAARYAAASKPRPLPPRPMPVSEQVGEFVAAFPLLTQNSGDLDAVFDSAKRRHVELLKGEYQTKSEPQTPLVTCTATFPVRSDYGAIKEFIADVLAAAPNAALDNLRLSRSDAGSTTLEAVIRFTFVYRAR